MARVTIEADAEELERLGLSDLVRRTAGDESEWLTVKEVAGRVGVNENTVYGWIKAGQVKSKRIGPRRVYVHRDSVQ